ncbi:MAG: dTMP kinase [Cyanobacteria bacterium P01_F01_bin.53]
MRGKLIVFEGGEGSGKTTQIQRLYDWLADDKTLASLGLKDVCRGVKLTREPGGTIRGQSIRHLLLTTASQTNAPLVSKAELLLYAADRAQHVEEMLKPQLAEGYWVLCDRYTDSTVAYQGYGRQLDLALIHQLNDIATGGLKSDLTLWLNVPPSVGLARMHQRGQADRMEQASQAFHQRVYDGFAALASSTSEGQPNPYSSGPTEIIEGDCPIDDITAQIQKVILRRFSRS